MTYLHLANHQQIEIWEMNPSCRGTFWSGNIWFIYVRASLIPFKTDTSSFIVHEHSGIFELFLIVTIMFAGIPLIRRSG